MLCECGTHRQAAARQFDRSKAERELAAYQRKGPGLTTRRLLAGLRAAGASGSVLDVGSGMGALTLELLAAGGTQATCVDLAAGSIAVAQEEAARRGLRDRISWVEADFANRAEGFPTADIVALDKVVCCYPAFEPLLTNATAHCRHWLALSFPRDHWPVRAWIRLDNLRRRILGNAFRTFAHPDDAMETLLRQQGFRPVHRSRSLVWHMRVYAR